MVMERPEELSRWDSKKLFEARWGIAVLLGLAVHALAGAGAFLFRDRSVSGSGLSPGFPRASFEVTVSEVQKHARIRAAAVHDKGEVTSSVRPAAAAFNSSSNSGAGDSAQGELLGELKPRYPILARRRGQEGEVWVQVDIGKGGRVIEARVVRSSGHEALDEAALESFKEARFRVGSSVERVTKRVAVRFRLNSNVN